MSVAYVDSSVLVARALGEDASAAMARRLRGHSVVVTSTLTEAEVSSALVREGVESALDPLHLVQVVGVEDSLKREIDAVLAAGYVKGADCWHLAVALRIAAARDLTFLTLDKRQRAVAKTLGFKT